MSGVEYFIDANPVITYALIFLGMLIEGEGIVLFASVFAWQGLISWPILSIMVIGGTLVSDFVWYAGGKYLKDTRFGLWLDKRYEKTGRWVYENILSRYATYAILTKFMYFITKPTLFLAGWHKFPFKKFVKAAIISTLVWGIIILALGYFFGYAVNAIGFKKILHRLELFAVLLFVAIFVAERIINKLIFKKISKKS